MVTISLKNNEFHTKLLKDGFSNFSSQKMNREFEWEMCQERLILPSEVWEFPNPWFLVKGLVPVHLGRSNG